MEKEVKIKIFNVIIISVLHVYTAWASIKIEEIKENNLDGVFPIYQQLNTWISKDEFMDNLFKAKQYNYFFYKAIDIKDLNIIGLIGYQFIQQLYVGRYMHLDSFVIDKNYRGKGYGKELFKFILEKFKEDSEKNNCKDLRWETGVTRAQAQEFYEKGLKLKPSNSKAYIIKKTDLIDIMNSMDENISIYKK